MRRRCPRRNTAFVAVDRSSSAVRMHELNEAIWSGVYRDGHEAPTFDPASSSEPRVNGRYGLRTPIDLDRWELRVLGPDGTRLGTHDMDDLRALPKVEMTVEHKCIEGWSHVVTWGGTPFSNLAALYREQLGGATRYVSLSTPDRAYYVGMDWDSMMHSQTLLTYELQGRPLSVDHGAPLRLTTTLKYGIKMIKRIGTVQFTDERPRDYWATRGYDWYAAL
jgi:DMSO/TMAO reductase YedYZ molybdopterin-dependent catalytic subunit